MGKRSKKKKEIINKECKHCKIIFTDSFTKCLVCEKKLNIREVKEACNSNDSENQ